jgi:hypothetical protein
MSKRQLAQAGVLRALLITVAICFPTLVIVSVDVPFHLVFR